MMSWARARVWADHLMREARLGDGPLTVPTGHPPQLHPKRPRHRLRRRRRVYQLSGAILTTSDRGTFEHARGQENLPGSAPALANAPGGPASREPRLGAPSVEPDRPWVYRIDPEMGLAPRIARERGADGVLRFG